jgi:chaperone BCS1
MTTNHPEKLDEALIRPGRVDHQVSFGNATQTQIKELFQRMYTNDLPKTKLIIREDSETPTEIPKKEKELLTPPSTPKTSSPVNLPSGLTTTTTVATTKTEDIKEGELSEIAAEFAVKVPEGLFSPAEIQGFLLKRKTEPRKALLEVDAWVEGMSEIKKGGTKVFGMVAQ